MRRRLLVWLRRTLVELRRKWWVWLLLLIWKVIENHILGVVDQYASSHKGVVAKLLKPIIGYMISNPVIITAILAIIILLGLIVHAYFETRPARAKPSIRGAGEFAITAPQLAGTLEARHIPAPTPWAKVQRFIRRMVMPKS